MGYNRRAADPLEEPKIATARYGFTNQLFRKYLGLGWANGNAACNADSVRKRVTRQASLVSPRRSESVSILIHVYDYQHAHPKGIGTYEHADTRRNYS